MTDKSHITPCIPLILNLTYSVRSEGFNSTGGLKIVQMQRISYSAQSAMLTHYFICQNRNRFYTFFLWDHILFFKIFNEPLVIAGATGISDILDISFHLIFYSFLGFSITDISLCIKQYFTIKCIWLCDSTFLANKPKIFFTRSRNQWEIIFNGSLLKDNNTDRIASEKISQIIIHLMNVILLKKDYEFNVGMLAK